MSLPNPSPYMAAVQVFIGGNEMIGSPFTLPVGASTRKSFLGVNNGPVKIKSNVNIVAAERVIYNVNSSPISFSEMMGLPDSQLNTTYWFPWYNNIDLDTQLNLGIVKRLTSTLLGFKTVHDLISRPLNLRDVASTHASFLF